MLKDTDACRVDEDAVPLAPVDHLRIPGDELDTGGIGALPHGPNDPPEHLHRQALLEDEARAQEEGSCATRGEVVHGSGDGELADVSAREEEWLDDVGIGGEGKAA